MNTTRRAFNTIVAGTIGTAVLAGRSVLAGVTARDEANPLEWDQDVIDRFLALAERGPIQLAGSTDTMVSPGAEHSFNINTYIKRAQIPACRVIVQTGFLAQADGWVTIPAFEEHVSVFCNVGVGELELTREQFSRLMSGDITNWMEIGGPRAAVKVFRLRPSTGLSTSLRGYASALDHRFRIALHSARLDAEQIMRRVTTVDSYDALAEAVRNEPGGLAVGLRETSFEGLLPASIDGMRFRLRDMNPDYPFQYNVALSIRNSRESSDPARVFFTEIERRRKIDINHWEDFEANA